MTEKQDYSELLSPLFDIPLSVIDWIFKHFKEKGVPTPSLPPPLPSPPPEYVTPPSTLPPPTPIPVPTLPPPAPTPEPLPEPAELWPYEIDKRGDIWHAKDPCKYIIPDNKVINYYAEHTYLDGEGKLRYDNGNIFRNHFVSDAKWPNRDYWYNPDYYLTHGNNGDCEDFVIALVSILIAKGIPAVVVAGYQKYPHRLRHFAAEYVYKGKVLFKDLNTVYTAPTRDRIYKEFKLFSPTWMFNNKITWRRYESDWYRLHGVSLTII